jgi:cytochrome P450
MWHSRKMTDTGLSTGSERATPRARREHVRPLVSRALPLVGHAFEFGRDPDAFIAKCRARYGEVFRLKLPGGERTFLLDPRDYPAVFAEERFRFQESAAEIGGRVFGFEPSLAIDPKFHELSVITSREMRGDPLQIMSERMQVIFARRVIDDLEADRGRGGERRLLAFLSDHFFAAGIDALFGDGFSSPSLYASYEIVDRHFASAVAGVPAFLLPGFLRARAELVALSGRSFPNHGVLLDTRTAYFERIGLPQDLRDRFDASVLWASQANTVVAAFWTLFHLLRDAVALAAVRAELREVVGAPSASRDAPPFTRDVLKRLVVLDSACSEALRLASGPMNGRRATESFDFELAAGGTIAFREGEDILLYPRHTHFDPEVFEDPTAFRFDRFVDARGRAAQFAKNGQRLTMPFLPFGGGATMCPGRFFARNEIKVLVAMMLYALETKLEDATTPALDFSRIGLGVLPPKSDVTIRIRRS